jgi:hypothetical protein
VGPIEHQDMTGITKVGQMQDKQYAVLLDLLEYLQKTGVEALFLLSPYQMDEDAKAQFNFMIPIIEKAGFPVLDLNEHLEEMGMDYATDFYDYGSHDFLLLLFFIGQIKI